MSDNEFIRELEEDMRAAKAQALWQRYGNLIIGIALVIVLGTAAGEVWKNHRRAEAQAETGKLLTALSSEDKDRQQIELSDLVKADPASPVSGITALQLAGRQPDKTALAAYQALAANAHQDAGLRALAQVLAAHAALNLGTPLPPISPKASAPFAAEAREADAWRLYQDGKSTEAQALFGSITEDPAAPPGLRQRAAIMASYLAGGK